MSVCGVIYVFTNTVSGKQYVGQTTVDAQRRRREHYTAARANHDDYPFYHALRKYGEGAFRFEVVYAAFDQEELDGWVRGRPRRQRCP